MQSFYLISIAIMLLLINVTTINARTLENSVTDSKYIVKRGYSAGAGNDYGPAIQVSSGILRLEDNNAATHVADGTQQQYDARPQNPWKAPEISSGYEVWLDSGSSLLNYKPILQHAAPAPAIDIAELSVFSTDLHGGGADNLGSHLSAHTSEVGHGTALDGHISGVLHTQISSSHDGVSGNVDFNNVADLKSKYRSKSYGR